MVASKIRKLQLQLAITQLGSGDPYFTARNMKFESLDVKEQGGQFISFCYLQTY
jgi:hypothetical protein